MKYFFLQKTKRETYCSSEYDIKSEASDSIFSTNKGYNLPLSSKKQVKKGISYDFNNSTLFSGVSDSKFNRKESIDYNYNKYSQFTQNVQFNPYMTVTSMREKVMNRNEKKKFKDFRYDDNLYKDMKSQTLNYEKVSNFTSKNKMKFDY